ncbi:MAG: nitrate reductase [gamma proteobacterium symbiont of Bathyaustriella thionipta]|nr:nitrate reductase [gamma proteobacterium symbiont of Bathyaustriella thionipta]MCU7949253.1 nitrate reductase [gamma proteobacterium symbiont of Bathyaustriella thionipta]MCU7953677.1 nitrate reductase [gamma proteobacterium symbiont of Bathyaustriella thionipta]MCU7955841.1 nitrate reductase [gamma proteobacterium symbiont of Bathyaustriella thionipta]MCU7966931.1 nitrate reductase [gamma proteobacterium symbiont of Bathyaustriella thionipta]
MLFGRNKKNPIKIADKKVVEWKYATCGYCSTGCSIEVGFNDEGKAVSSRGVADADVNRGKLCLKGIFEHELFTSAGRGLTPLQRDNWHQSWQRTSWDIALDQVYDGIKTIQDKYGRDSFAVISTGQMLTEEFYTLGKLTRGLIGTNNYDGNTTLCMASAVSGYKRSFGSDGPPGCYEDFEHTDCLIAWGSNLPEQHPIIYWRFKEAQEKRRFPLIVVDPRVTMLAQNADIHLAITPGTDVVLQNALMHVIFNENLQDNDYIMANTNGLDELMAEVEKYDPISAAKICGIDEDTIRSVARLYAGAGAAMSIWTMGINQSTHGSDGVVGINNLALITGNIGKPGGTSLSITGQCNAMGTREWSSCSGLPNHRLLENEQDRKDIAEFWNIDEEFLPKKRGMFQTDIYHAIEAGHIKGLWLIATNPLSSLPNSERVRRAMQKLEFCVVQDCYEDSESNQYAHVYLPAGTWAEKEGVMTNTERRINLINAIIPPQGEAKPDLWIFNQMAKRFNQDGKVSFPDKSADIFLEMGRISKGRLADISGMDHALLEKSRGVQWPYTEQQASAGEAPPPGGKRLYTEPATFRYADGKAKLIPLPFIDNNEVPDEKFPVWLNTGRLIEHWHGRTKTGKIGNNNKYSPIPFIEINPDLALELGIKRGEYVRLVSRRSDAVVMATPTQRVPKNMVFLPFHFHDCANRLTLGLLDPHSRQPAYKQSAVRIERLEDQKAAAQLSMEMRNF